MAKKATNKPPTVDRTEQPRRMAEPKVEPKAEAVQWVTLSLPVAAIPEKILTGYQQKEQAQVFASGLSFDERRGLLMLVRGCEDEGIARKNGSPAGNKSAAIKYILEQISAQAK